MISTRFVGRRGLIWVSMGAGEDRIDRVGLVRFGESTGVVEEE